MKETFTKINNNTFKRLKEVEQEDIFELSNLEQKKRDLEEQIANPQKRLDEINYILKEIKKVE